MVEEKREMNEISRLDGWLTRPPGNQGKLEEEKGNKDQMSFFWLAILFSSFLFMPLSHVRQLQFLLKVNAFCIKFLLSFVAQ